MTALLPNILKGPRPPPGLADKEIAADNDYVDGCPCSIKHSDPNEKLRQTHP